MRIVQRVIKFNQKGFAKDIYWYEYQAKKKAKNDFVKGFFNLMNNAVFGKNMENLRKNRNIKLLTTERRRNYWVSEPNYHTAKCFTEHLLAIEMKKLKD